MDKENNVVYVETKKGIFKCYKSEQMHKPIYYPVESKTNGYIDYNNVIRILNIDDLYKQCKNQKEVIDKTTEWVRDWIHGTNDWFEEDAKPSELLDILNEVSE